MSSYLLKSSSYYGGNKTAVALQGRGNVLHSPIQLIQSLISLIFHPNKIAIIEVFHSTVDKFSSILAYTDLAIGT
jgi:hypothetical protein